MGASWIHMCYLCSYMFVWVYISDIYTRPLLLASPGGFAFAFAPSLALPLVDLDTIHEETPRYSLSFVFRTARTSDCPPSRNRSARRVPQRRSSSAASCFFFAFRASAPFRRSKLARIRCESATARDLFRVAPPPSIPAARALRVCPRRRPRPGSRP